MIGLKGRLLGLSAAAKLQTRAKSRAGAGAISSAVLDPAIGELTDGVNNDIAATARQAPTPAELGNRHAAEGPRFRLAGPLAARPQPAARAQGAAVSPLRAAAPAMTAAPLNARAAARARTAAVFASEHSVGRERQAADMLGTRMNAAEIVGLLAKAPKAAAATSWPLAGGAVGGHASALLRARAVEAAGAALAATARADQARPDRSAADIDASWQRAREFNKTGRRPA